MKSWDHLIEAGQAEYLAPDKAEVHLNRFMIKVRALNPQASDRLLDIFRYRCKVVRFKKGAVIADFGHQNPQLLFKESGEVKTYFGTRNPRIGDWWLSTPKDWIFDTKNYENTGGFFKIVASKTSVFVTFHWDQHNYLLRKIGEFMGISFSFVAQLNRELRASTKRHPKSNGLKLRGM